MSDHTSDSPRTKTCTKCGRELLATPEYFTRTSSTRDGLHTQCKECRQKHNRAYWQENREAINERQRESYPERRERALAYHKRWREKNREYDLAKKREWYQQNRDQNLANSRAWRAQNREYMREYDRQYRLAHLDEISARQQDWTRRNRARINAQRRQRYNAIHEVKEGRRLSNVRREARKRGLPDAFSRKDWRFALAWFEGRCVVCGSTEDLHADHWRPLNSDHCPGTVPGNMVPLCRSCNFSKQDSDPGEWLRWKVGIDRAVEILERVQLYFQQVEERR